MNSNWEEILKDRLQFYGHHYFLVIYDSYYPSQVFPGYRPSSPTKNILAPYRGSLQRLANQRPLSHNLHQRRIEICCGGGCAGCLLVPAGDR